MNVIADYGVGNLFSLKCSFAAVGQSVIVTSDGNEILKADRIILPGVGAFSDAAKKLKESGLGKAVKKAAENGVPLLGVCLGMQLLFEKSFEYGEWEGLGLLSGSVRPLSDIVPAGYKIPHTGWNALEFKKDSKLFKYVKNGEHVYFVHSYYAAECEDEITSVTEYGAPVTASVERCNVFGCQFHPEKSGETGLMILKAFCEVKK